MKPNSPTRPSVLSQDQQAWGKRPVIWALRMLRPDVPGLLECLSPSERREAGDFLDLAFPSDSDRKVDQESTVTTVEERYQTLCSASAGEPVLYQNLHSLQTVLGLTQIELDLIAFRAMLRLHPGFEALAGKYIGLCADFVFHRKLAHLFAVAEQVVTEALAPAGTLVRSGLMEVERGILGPLEHRIRLVQGLISPLTMPAGSADDLLGSLLPRKRTAHLDLAAYPHLQPEISLLQRHLRTALASRTVGTNILLYGQPGTGKTELAAALAAALRCPLYACAPAPEDGDSLTPRYRICNLVQLQKLVRVTRGGIVLIDEAEDLFPVAWSDARMVPSKAAVNECLETNPAPTIWISNRTRHIDEAFLRRFDLVIHVPPLPTAAKCKLLRDLLPPLALDKLALRQLAERRELSPAVIARMANVATEVSHADPSEACKSLQLLSRHYLEILDADPLRTGNASADLPYDPVLLNTDPPLDRLLASVHALAPGARMLLHGLPGTGKTALAKALAERLDRPLLKRRASSLLSCLVGQTEHNLREMFDEARRDGSVLLLDEADSFLRSRERAGASWEVTQTNELLTQMETFEGAFVCTTNRLEDLDPAALRRFDIKVAFRPLHAEQRVRLLRQCCNVLGLGDEAVDKSCRQRAARLDGLTPGDAATALRRLRLSGEPPTLVALLDALADECRYKLAAHKPIGFVQ